MSNTAHPDDIEALMSSVRDFVSHKDSRKSVSRKLPDRLVLTPDQLVAEPSDVAEDPVKKGSAADSSTGNIHPFEPANRDEKANLEAALSALGGSAAAIPDAGKVLAKKAADTKEKEAKSAPVKTTDSAKTSADDATKAVETDSHATPQEKEASEDPATTTPAENLLAQAGADAMAHEALRALIIEIVHEELASDLGERMTRNVRKLVRREINRVLTSRELERDDKAE